MDLTYFGHSCFSICVNGKHIVFDPFITANPLAKHIDISTIKADYIFLSHGHFDHMMDTALLAQNTGGVVIANWELYNWYLKQGFSKIQPLNPGGKWEFEFGTVHCVAAAHSSSLPDGTYGGSACGFVVLTEEGNFYYSGDSALTMDMKLIARYGCIDFAVLPIGDALTMGVEDGIELAEWLDVVQVVGVHYDTFEFIKIDKPRAIDKFSSSGVKLHLLDVGARIKLYKKEDSSA